MSGRYWFQDGAQAHRGHDDNNLSFLQGHLTMTPLDIFLWGHIKDRVYTTVLADLQELRRRITQ